MKLSQDEKTAISLNKEYLTLKKYAERVDAPSIERDYYFNMARNVSSRIDWKLLEPHKRQTEEDYKYNEEYGYKESRTRHHR